MKQFLSVILFFLITASSGYAQDAFYYYNEQKIPLIESPRWMVVQVPEAAQSAFTESMSRRTDIRIRRVLDEKRGFYWLEARGQQELGPDVLDQLSEAVSITRTFPAYYRVEHSDTSHFVMTDEFQVQFDGAVSRSQIDALNAEHGVEVAPFESEIDERQAHEYNEYVLRVTEKSEYNALEAANRYHEDPRTKWASPNFFVKVRFEGTKENVGFALRAPTPNPTADRARLQVHVPEARTVTIVVHDLMGREVARLADRRMRPGIHPLTVQARQWPSAVYLVRMRAGQFSATERLTVVR
jgi:hypothetical protein